MPEAWLLVSTRRAVSPRLLRLASLNGKQTAPRRVVTVSTPKAAGGNADTTGSSVKLGRIPLEMKTAAIRSTARPPAKGQKRKRAVADAAVLAPAVEAASAHALETPVVAHVNAADPAAPAVSLASSCTVKDAAAIKRSLDALAQADTAVVIDASGVERIDTAIV